MRQTIMNFLFFILLLLLGITLFYLLGKAIWYPYYEKCFIERDIKPLECKKCEPTLIEPDPIAIPKPKEQLSSTKRLHRLLGDSDFVIYPKKLTLIGMKHERVLEVWGELRGQWRLIGSYPFTSFSGRLGPKFREGDRQIPEGIYSISYLNPNSKFHLSMRVNYPNAFDKKMAKKEKRTNLGGDIMIHGKNATIGCIPIGDEGIEELYLLAEKVGIANIKVILSPVDFRTTKVNIKNDKYPWLAGLYSEITKEMQPFISK